MRRRVIGLPWTCGRNGSVGPPERTGRGAKRARLSMRSYMTMAPAAARLMQNRVGMRTTWSHRATMAGDSALRSGPNT